MGFYGPGVTFLSLNHHCLSSEGNVKHSPQPNAWPHQFFINHQTQMLEAMLSSCQVSDASTSKIIN